VSHPFRATIEAGDVDAAIALLAPDVVFRSPVVHRPYAGADAVAGLLRAVFEVFEDFRYVDELGAESGGHALIFAARVGDRELEGMDLLYDDADGRIARFTVMVRPLSGALALAEAMKSKLGG
jgi:ketosteroid isomerase-like protein